MGRAPCCDKANVKKGPWSPEEDSKLKQFIQKYGTAGNWISLPQKAGLKRCGKSCRLRWLNYLRPNIKHGEFSDEEDRIICTLFSTIGSRWSIIAAQLPGRTDNDVKNYWNTKLKKKLMVLVPQSQKKPLTSQSEAPHPLSSSFLYTGYDTYAPYPYLNPPIPPLNSFQGQEGLTNPIQYHHHQAMVEKDDNNNNMMLVFGSEASGSSNSPDGNCSQISCGKQIKQEEMGFQSFISNWYEENKKFMLSYENGNDDDHQEQNWKQWSSASTDDEEANWKNEVEEVKQVISSQVNSSNSKFLSDDNMEKDKFIYYY